MRQNAAEAYELAAQAQAVQGIVYGLAGLIHGDKSGRGEVSSGPAQRVTVFKAKVSHPQAEATPVQVAATCGLGFPAGVLHNSGVKQEDVCSDLTCWFPCFSPLSVCHLIFINQKPVAGFRNHVSPVLCASITPVSCCYRTRNELNTQI